MGFSSRSKEITVNKDRLLAKLKENRSRHVKEYEDLIGKYWTELAEEMKQFVEDAEKHKRADHKYKSQLPRPRNHKKDYDRAITALQWEVNDEVTITIEEMEKYVNDNWSWKHEFQTTASNYV